MIKSIYKTESTPYALNPPQDTVVVTKTTAMGCTVSNVTGAIGKFIKKKTYHMPAPLCRSTVSICVANILGTERTA